ncbi:hypothetical protein U5N28_19295 [Lysinibacillus telephonicus]|uniref:hypothetical protein n=1 Tax=Lysinibacillus telephonicus TaxID=1714840 RepID=UPI00397A1478
MDNFEDDLPFESNSYQKSKGSKISSIQKYLAMLDNQVEVEDFLDSVESYLLQKLRIKEFKTDFTQMKELVEYLDEHLYIPVYGDWGKVDNKYVQKVAKNIKEHLQNGLIREIEITIGKNGNPYLNIKGFGEYEKNMDLKENERLIHFKIHNK